MPTESGEVIQEQLAALRQQVGDLNKQIYEKNKRIHELEDQVTKLLYPAPVEHRQPQDHIPIIPPQEKPEEPPAKPRTLPAKRAKIHKK
jgi:chromosome segregation ATPase